MVLRMCLRRGENLGEERIRIGVRLAGPARQSAMTPARKRVLELLADGLLRSKREAAEEAGVSPGVIDGLVDDGALEALPMPVEPVARMPDPTCNSRELSDAQRTAAEALCTDVWRPEKFSATLLDGVTGSGKTEVYFEAIAENIRRGRQSLILMPEIALTTQFLDRFSRALAYAPPSGTPMSRRASAQSCGRRQAQARSSVVAGARSALFLPFTDLGLIIIDEEHDGAYKQDDGVHYHARDMAVVRARLNEIPIVLSSATPSVETEVNARRGRYKRLKLPERFGGQQMPSIEAIDMRREGPPRGRYIAPRLAEAIQIALERKEQALLFLNRRGYAPLTLCRTCGHRFACPELRCVAGRPPLSQAAGVPSLRLFGCHADCVLWNAQRRVRWWRAAPAWNGWRGGRQSVSKRAGAHSLERPDHRRRAHARRTQADHRWPRRSHRRHCSLSPRGIIFLSSTSSALSMPTLACRTAIPAPRNGRSSSLHQVAGRAGREEGRGIGFLQTPSARASGDARTDFRGS